VSPSTPSVPATPSPSPAPAQTSQNQNPTPTPTPATPSSSTPATPSSSTTTPAPPATTGSNSNPAPATPPTPTPPPPAPPTFPDGTLLVNAQTGELAQYSAGARHLISPPVAAKMGITPAQLTPVTSDKFTLIPLAQDYYPDGMFLRNDQTGEISEYAGGAFHLVSVPVATKLGLTSKNVVTITAAQYNKVSKGDDFFAEGMLLKNVQTGELDIYSAGQRHTIPVPAQAKMNIAASSVATIGASQFNAIQRGIDYFPEGSYVTNVVTGAIAQYSGGYLHSISTPVATVMGLKSTDLIPVTQGEFNAIPMGLAYYPNGIFISNNQTSEVNEMSGGQRLWVSPQDVQALGLTSNQIAAISANEFNSIPVGGVFAMPAGSSSSQSSSSTAGSSQKSQSNSSTS
jgi:hypothetical protein